MFAFDVFGNFDLVCQCQAKRLAAKNISKVTYFCRVGRKTSINQS